MNNHFWATKLYFHYFKEISYVSGHLSTAVIMSKVEIGLSNYVDTNTTLMQTVRKVQNWCIGIAIPAPPISLVGAECKYLGMNFGQNLLLCSSCVYEQVQLCPNTSNI